jgi:hypothetical protein
MVSIRNNARARVIASQAKQASDFLFASVVGSRQSTREASVYPFDFSTDHLVKAQPASYFLNVQIQTGRQEHQAISSLSTMLQRLDGFPAESSGHKTLHEDPRPQFCVRPRDTAQHGGKKTLLQLGIIQTPACKFEHGPGERKTSKQTPWMPEKKSHQVGDIAIATRQRAVQVEDRQTTLRRHQPM